MDDFKQTEEVDTCNLIMTLKIKDLGVKLYFTQSSQKLARINMRSYQLSKLFVNFKDNTKYFPLTPGSYVLLLAMLGGILRHLKKIRYPSTILVKIGSILPS